MEKLVDNFAGIFVSKKNTAGIRVCPDPD